MLQLEWLVAYVSNLRDNSASHHEAYSRGISLFVACLASIECIAVLLSFTQTQSENQTLLIIANDADVYLVKV